MTGFDEIVFCVRAGPSGPTVFASYCGKRKTPSGENHIGVWWWSREELRLVLTIQHTNNTHTVEQQWEFYSDLSLIIDIQTRPTVCMLRRGHRG